MEIGYGWVKRYRGDITILVVVYISPSDLIFVWSVGARGYGGCGGSVAVAMVAENGGK